MQSARYLQSRLAPLTAALSRESPAALKYALCLLGLMSPTTRLPIVELADAAKAEVASAIAEIGDEDFACPIESWHGRLVFAQKLPLRRIGVSNEFRAFPANEWRARTLRAWQLAILRFAVTLDNADRLAIMAIASEIDRLGPDTRRQAGFWLFSPHQCGALRRHSAAE